ncbi:hypothetical protein LCGC14_0303430 [marine sediment metagenome]|uniref:Uncharacterized protein n=1 Tax=marine sediment metagenome TaxID=412755 RepID=A0A0F9U6X3_9ZZZZ
MRRGHRKTRHNEEGTKVIDVPERKTRRVELRRRNSAFSPEVTGPTELEFEVNSEAIPDSTIALTSLGTVESEAKINLVPENSPAAVGWKSAESQDEVVRVISEIFPEYPNQYIIGRGMQARGYHVRQDGSVILVDGKRVDRIPIDDVDFFVFSSDTEDMTSTRLQQLGEARQRLDGPFPFSKTGHLRTFVIGVLGDSGQLYGIRVQYVNLQNPRDRIHRVKNNARGEKIQSEWDFARRDPRYQRQNLHRLEFEVADIYE